LKETASKPVDIDSDGVFNRIVDEAKHYKPGYEGLTPQIAESWTEGYGPKIIRHPLYMSFRDSDNPFTLSRIREKRKSWKERQAMARREHQQNPLKYYCDKIECIVPDYEISFEEDYKANLEHLKRREQQTKDLLESFNDKYPPEEMTELERRVYDIEIWGHGKRENKIARHTKPPELTKTQWKKEQSKKRKAEREEEKQRRADDELERNSPLKMFHRMTDELDEACECEAEKMRQGEFCDICKLVTKVREYMLDVFKAAAEGRASFV
jgi:hypothetical protein